MPLTRRDFLRSGSIAALGALAACVESKRPTASTPPATTTAPPRTSESPLTVWRRFDSPGPSARFDHTFTGDPATGFAFLFGGRDDNLRPLDDLWIFDGTTARWEKVTSKGPAPRFGHAAVVIASRLVLFGGQGGPGTFFNDAWEFDRAARAWVKLSPRGRVPNQRYGTGAAVVGEQILITHGFTDTGRFDDTWTLGANAWTDVSPASGPRPVKRCLHRTAWWPGTRSVALFGGQTTGTPFLGDFWLYDPESKQWRQAKYDAAPEKRNLQALFVLGDRLWMFGGQGKDGALADLSYIASGQTTWNNLDPPGGPAPTARSGIEAAVVGPKRALIFGGKGGGGALNDFWEFNDLI